jgi:hypothetical protein
MYGYKKGEKISHPPFLFLLDSIRDPGWKKSGSGINFPDPQHWFEYFYELVDSPPG